MSNVIHPAFLRDSEKKELKKDLPGPDAQVWIYTEPGVERKLATVLDPKMIDSRILDSITIPQNALFTARFNKADAFEERRLREWPDDSKYTPDEYVSVVNDEKWQWYYTEPKSFKEVWEGVLPSPGKQVWVYKKPGIKGELATVVDTKKINSRVLDRITIPPHTLFTAWVNENSEYVPVLKNEDWEWYPPSLRLDGARGDEVWVDHPMDQSGPPVGSAGTMPYCWRKPAKKIVDLKDVIQKEVDKQLDSNGHLERIQFQNEIIKKQKKEIKELKEMMNMERKCMQYELDDAEQEINALNKENKEMTGSLVKVEWIIEQVKKVGGFTDTGKAVAEAFEYIDFPETSEVEKEDFVASSITNSVVQPSSIQEDREFYGEDFHEESEGEDEIADEQVSESETTPEQNTIENTTPPETTVESIIQCIHDIYDLRETSQGNLVPRRLFFEAVENSEDQRIPTNSTTLPWYEERYPTPLEVQAITTIQNYIRNHE
tara:strand:- start:1825 stop:3291 length:1467 start_codon:yes stop_codon:yes gene_type:complete